ncbi:hypothetical protein AWC28_21000 [Mycolicibacter terrae]|nr:hypothetical protein AWC28_20895 [Mycolicibacter terrae]ORW89231.1 hypothetical protein AWC28_21000 [Mycolicibacter terrae]
MQPSWTLQEAYRFRVVAEGFNGAPGHVWWVQRDGKWYQAKWIDFDFEAEHVRALVPHIDAERYGAKPWGMNKWNPIGIKDIHKLQVSNPRLSLLLPTTVGGASRCGRTRRGWSRDRDMTTSRYRRWALVTVAFVAVAWVTSAGVWAFRHRRASSAASVDDCAVVAQLAQLWRADSEGAMDALAVLT